MSVLFSRVRDERLSEKVVQQLLMHIRSGQVSIGDKLPPESTLAEQLGVSRSILREALTVLEIRGYLRRAPREGTTVIRSQEDNLAEDLTTQLKKATLLDLLEFRETMECKVVEKVIDRASDEEIEALSELLDQEELAVNSKDYYFHYRLASLSGNSLFASFIDTYYELIKELRDISCKVQDRAPCIRREHQRIIKALLRRDKAAARRAVRSHLQAVGRLMDGHIG